VIDLAAATEYIRRRLEASELLAEHLVPLVLEWQVRHGLDQDGLPGRATLASLEQALRSLRPVTLAKVYPMRQLPDGRRPVITSRFRTRNPGRPTHNGVDLFYAYWPSDGPVPVGDGGAARGPAGSPKWWIPAGEHARAAAEGVVTRASRIATGYRVAVEHLDGFETIYCHLRGLAVQVGEVGDNPGDIDAEHRHFEVTRAGRYEPQDPELWLEGAGYLP
jgi:hypothetical protein